MRRVSIIAGVITPFARAGTVFKDLSAIELGKRCVAELIQRTELDGDLVEALVYGTVVPSVVAPNIAREISLLPILPKGCQAYTVSRACASANQAITDAADQIVLGHADVVIAERRRSRCRTCRSCIRDRDVRRLDGVCSRPRRSGATRANRCVDPPTRSSFRSLPAIAEPSTGETMGESAEKMAKINHIPREDQDQYALRSHRLAAVGTEDGRLTSEIVPVYVPPRLETWSWRRTTGFVRTRRSINSGR